MEYRLLFVIPFIIASSGVLFLMCIKHGMPEWLTVRIGGLQPDDMHRLTPEHQKGLRKQTCLGIPPATAVTLLLGWIFSMLSIENMIIVVICLIIQYVVSTILLTPLFRLAKSIKAELDLHSRE